MRYVVLIGAEGEPDPPERPAAQLSAVDAHDAFQRHVAERGRLISHAALGSADTATTVHARRTLTCGALDPPGSQGPSDAQGSRAVDDGLLGAMTRQLVGYYDVELPDLDAAIAAARLLTATCTVEIRPVVVLSGHVVR